MVALLANHLASCAPSKSKKKSSIGKKVKIAAVVGGSAFVGYKVGQFATKLSGRNLGNHFAFCLIQLKALIVITVYVIICLIVSDSPYPAHFSNLYKES